LASKARGAGQKGWLWPAFASPGLLWLTLLFLVPFYAIFSIAMGYLDPVLNFALPVWNPAQWDPSIFGQVWGEVFGGQLGRISLRTVAYVAVASGLCIAIGYPVAYYIARRSGKRKTLLLVLLLAPFWINYLMRMLAWVNLLGNDGYVNRLLMFFGVLDAPRDWLVGLPETVILGLVYGYIPFFILPLYAALDRIDNRVLEAARDLGATPWQTFRRVTIPLSKQGILAGTVIIMLPMFGDYYTNQLLSGNPKTRMIGNEIESAITSGVNLPRGAALTVLLMLFVAILMVYYLFSVTRASREVS